MSAFAAQRAAARAAAAQLYATLMSFDALELEAGDPVATIAMDAVLERSCTTIRRVNELCDAVRAASPFPTATSAEAG